MTTKLEVKTEDTGAIAIPAKMLLEILKAFPDIPLTFTIDAGTFGVELTSDAGKYRLNGANGDEFPQIEELEDAAVVDMPADVLISAINRSLFAAGNDDLRPSIEAEPFWEYVSDKTVFEFDVSSLNADGIPDLVLRHGNSITVLVSRGVAQGGPL